MNKLLVIIENRKIQNLFNLESEYYIKGGYNVLYNGSYIENNNIILEFNIINNGNEKLIDIEICLDINSCIKFKNWRFE